MNLKNDLALWLQSQGVRGDLGAMLQALAAAGIEIAAAIETSALAGEGAAGSVNVQGEEQKALDIISNDIVLAHLAGQKQVAALVSEEIAELIIPDDADKEAPYVVCFDPLDGSSNIETNSAIGTIFSILSLKRDAGAIGAADVLAAAQNQIAAGYVLYGPTTILVLTTGKSVASFVLNRNDSEFILMEPVLSIPKQAVEFSINTAYARFWEKPLATYIENCVRGEVGPRGKAFNMRWSAAMVADVHRLFVRGGIFIYPALNRPGGENGKLRFLYEANPMAMLVEVGGGKAQMRLDPITSLHPTSLHQRVPVVLGSAEEVEILTGHYQN